MTDWLRSVSQQICSWVFADLYIGIVLLSLDCGAVQAQLHRSGEGCSIQGSLSEEPGTEPMRRREINWHAGKLQPVAEDGPQCIRGQSAGQGPVRLADRAKQRPLGDPYDLKPMHYRACGTAL